jgi:hypothetical protein
MGRSVLRPYMRWGRICDGRSRVAVLMPGGVNPAHARASAVAKDVGAWAAEWRRKVAATKTGRGERMHRERVGAGRSEPRPYKGEKRRGRGLRLRRAGGAVSGGLRLGFGEGAGGVDGDAAVDEQRLTRDVTA